MVGMKYVVPVNAPDEVSALAAAGADELYCGFLDAWWVERYGDHDSASRRQGAANLTSLHDLARTADACVKRGIPLYLALNARYTEPQLDHLVELCAAFERMGGTGIIASDLGLFWRLKDATRLERTVSLLAVVQNAPTLQAYARLEVNRVVLPRFMQPAEAAQLLAAVPGMQGESMAFFDKCPWVDGYCRHRHGVSYLPRQAAVNDAASDLFTFDTTYTAHACMGADCTYASPYPCAACYLPQFEGAGVAYAKLGGRGRPLEERLRALRFLREAEGRSQEEVARRYRETFGCACSCYYGEATQSRYAIEPIVHTNEGAACDFVGSETAFEPFRSAVQDLCQKSGAATGAETTLLVPPLSEESLQEFRTLLPALAEWHPAGLRIAVNDLGTFIVLSREQQRQRFPFTIVVGTLLARTDHPAEVAHFLSPEENPPRPVWGSRGEPRTRRYRRPPDPLIEHWSRPSLGEPSAQAALAFLTE